MKSLSIKTRGLDLPLIQGGMGIGVSLGNLAGHVARCGGMGVISAANPGYRQPDFRKNSLEANIRALKAEIWKAKEIASDRGMVAVNILYALNHSGELAKAAVEAGADAIIAGAGLPTGLPQFTLGTDTAIAPIVSSAKVAALILKAWKRKYNVFPDFLVVEGSKAGGHLGFSLDELVSNQAKPLEQIVSEVAEVIKPYEAEKGQAIPIFAAGGIYTAQDIKRAVASGAAGVQIATRFIATEECDASPEFKQAFINARQEEIILVNSPVGMPGRAIKSPLTERLELAGRISVKSCVGCLKTCNPATTPYCITEALSSAVMGDWENGLFFCGSNAYKLDRITTVKQLISELTH